MDDKKKNVPEETKDTNDLEDVIEVVDFSDIQSALNKLDEKKAALAKEKKVENEKGVEEKKNSDVKASEKKEDEKKTSDEKVSEKKVDEKKALDEKVSEKKEDEKKASEEKTSEKKETEKKASEEKASEKKKDEKKTSEEKASEKKEDEKKASDEKASDKKEEKKSETKALTQSKRLADAKALEAEKSATEEPYVTKIEKKSKKGVGIFFGVLAALIVIVYVTGFVYFSNYFYPDVAINGTNVSNMNKATAKQTLDNFYKDYVLTLVTIDGKEIEIKGTDIDMNIQLQEDLSKCLKEQEAYLWFMNLAGHHDYTIGANATWNEDALEELYKSLKMLDKKLMTTPKDAYIGVEDGKFAIVKEELGTTILVDNFKSTVNDSLTGVAATVNLKDAGCYELPKVYQDDATLNSEFSTMSEFADGVITIQMDDLTLEPGMELYNEVLQKDGDTYTISKTKVQSYVKELANQYDTMGKDRNFTSSYENNKVVKVTGTAFGYELDQEATANALYTALQSKKATTVDAVFKSKGYTLQGENDIGDTYIEVNLSLQKVIAYKDGKKIVEGDCVSGKEATGDGTCLGLYKIQDKLSPTVLRGQQKEVTKTVTKKKKGKKVKVKETKMEYEYESPVTFWMQFNGGYGLHDAAQWRSTYGGSIYYYSGSHGCVNLPYDVAEKLYKNFEVGDPVIVYFWDNENRK